MTILLKSFLFEKGYLVHKKANSTENADDVVLALMTLFGLRVTEGFELADREMIVFLSDEMDVSVPLPFYRGFPESVRNMSKEQLLFDQLVHYVKTYGFGHFDEAGHSIMETYVERSAMAEHLDPTTVRIVTEENAWELLQAAIVMLLASTRPLNDRQLDVVKDYVEAKGIPCEIASKNTAIRLLISTKEMAYADSLVLSDVIKVTEYVCHYGYPYADIRHLNLKNRDRKFLTQLIDRFFESGVCNIRECYEKKALWCGLLHHLHYVPKTPEAQTFVKAMRSKGNESVYSAFEKAMLERDIRSAADILEKGKGEGAVLRNLHYLLSRCRTVEEAEYVIDHIRCGSVMILLQLLTRYCTYDDSGKRTFRFLRFENMTTHTESDDEARRRRTLLSAVMIDLLQKRVREALSEKLANRIGKVYLDEDMRRYALPMQESSSMGGLGVLPKGSRLQMPEGKKLRAFVYWEGVNDIDLSVIGIDAEQKQYEFSWRSMASRQSKAVTYSGDETAGMHGGSEYFDIDLEELQKEYPTIEKLIFNANVYSDSAFGDCFCRAGYMLRDIEDSGEIYEPKTVRSAFRITSESVFSHLFAIDMTTREFVWLNASVETHATVAGTVRLAYLLPYFKMTECMNLYTFFEMLACEMCDKPEEADVIVSDRELPMKEGAEWIRPVDFEKIFPYMNMN
ncbi:MAG: hypothetical protein IKC63_05215 [Clostridia bacterium]|nr:hypothetical protein [Clostridia bacterium]